MNLMDLLFPKLCISCGYPGLYICPKCRNTKLTIYHQQACHVCREPIHSGYVHQECLESTHLDGVFVCMAYTDLIKKIIVEIKYNNYFTCIDELAEMMIKLSRNVEFLTNGAFTSVPLSRFKLWKRGFNQAELLARQVAGSRKYLELLKRTKNTQTQVGKDKMSRQDNLQGAFTAINAGNISEVVIVDDVMTTGTTLEQCAKALKQSGVEKVYGLVLARGA